MHDVLEISQSAPEGVRVQGRAFRQLVRDAEAPIDQIIWKSVAPQHLDGIFGFVHARGAHGIIQVAGDMEAIAGFHDAMHLDFPFAIPALENVQISTLMMPIQQAVRFTKAMNDRPLALTEGSIAFDVDQEISYRMSRGLDLLEYRDNLFTEFMPISCKKPSMIIKTI